MLKVFKCVYQIYNSFQPKRQGEHGARFGEAEEAEIVEPMVLDHGLVETALTGEHIRAGIMDSIFKAE
jgi:hypothetical protein